jgi:membrane protein
MISDWFWKSSIFFTNLTFEGQKVSSNLVYGQYMNYTLTSFVNLVFVLIMTVLRMLSSKVPGAHAYAVCDKFNHVHQRGHSAMSKDSLTKVINSLPFKFYLDILVLFQILITLLVAAQYLYTIWMENCFHQFYLIQLFANSSYLIALIFNYRVGNQTYFLALFTSIKRPSLFAKLPSYLYILYWILIWNNQYYQITIIFSLSASVLNHINFRFAVLSFLSAALIILILIYQYINRQKVS